MRTALNMWEAGYHDLISVIPPNAELSPSSKVPTSALGKVPGRRNQNGQWSGWDWRRHETTEADVRQWDLDAANIGLRTTNFPAIDIDCTCPELTEIIVARTRELLGPAPLRVGRAPKSLLMYRTDQPFGKMRLWIKDEEGTDHVIEVLGEGQQFVALGTHPVTGRPYEWDVLTDADRLTLVRKDDVEALLRQLTDDLRMLDYEIVRTGSGNAPGQGGQDQDALKAPDMDALHECVLSITNSNDMFPDREDYLRIGYAIKAASVDDAAHGLSVFVDWAMTWEGNGKYAGNEEEVVRGDWLRMIGPYQIGWEYLTGLARGNGFNDAALEFDEVVVEPERGDPAPVLYSEQHLADEFLQEHRGVLRSIPQWSSWLAWDGRRWVKDASRLTEALCSKTLRRFADLVIRREERGAAALAAAISSAAKVVSVIKVAAADQSLVVSPQRLDAESFELNTENGIVDLITGELRNHDPDRLHTKLTGAPVDRDSACPQWERFIEETVAGDADMVSYLQRLAGYCLTGSVREHAFMFVWGPGGNGKSVFLNVLADVMGDYAKQAPMETFMAATGDRHPTELAALMGARLVLANEVEEGRRWNESRLKALTGGDPVSTRFMRGDFFTFTPQFKLLLVGNHKPALRNVDEAVRRRFHLIPFIHQPKVVDQELPEKLKAEYPAILAWMLEGCRMWQEQGLDAPESVRAATNTYFDEEDAMGRWLGESTVECNEVTSSETMYASWKDWCLRTGEYAGPSKRFGHMLTSRGYKRDRCSTGARLRGFAGINIRGLNEAPTFP